MRLRVILSCTMSTALAMVPKTLGGWCAGKTRHYLQVWLGCR